MQRNEIGLSRQTARFTGEGLRRQGRSALRPVGDDRGYCDPSYRILLSSYNYKNKAIGRTFKVRVSSTSGFKREDSRMRFLHLALADRRAQREEVFYLSSNWTL